MSDFIISYVIPLAYIAFGIAALSALAFPFIQMFSDLKKARNAFIGVGALVVIFIICYAMAGDSDFTIGQIHVAGSKMKVIEACLYAFYTTLFASVGAILYSTISSYFK